MATTTTDNLPGFLGVRVGYKRIVSPIAGFFGITVQKKTNVLLKVLDEKGEPLTGVTVSYPSGTDLVTFTTSAISSLYELAIPASTTTTITLSRIGYVTQSLQSTVAAGAFLEVPVTMPLDLVPYLIHLKAV